MPVRKHESPKQGRPQTNNNQHREYVSPYPNFCGECGSQLIWAPIDDDFTSEELVCPHCGLVYSPALTRVIRKQNHEWFRGKEMTGK